MKRFIPLMMVLSLSLVACEQHTTPPPARGVDQGNKEKNMYERNLGAVTPSDYPENNIPNSDASSTNPTDNPESGMRQEENDERNPLASYVRNNIMTDPSLSRDAQFGVSVRAKNGVVTLRGRLSKQDRDLVDQKVRAMLKGTAEVDNQIEVKENP